MGGGEIVRLGLRKTFMRLALVTSPARSATTMLYPMVLGKNYWLVADSEGGCWTSRDEERSQSCWDDGWRWLRWEDEGVRGREVVLVHPRHQITGARARGIVGVG